jgi:arginine decarboxylase
MLTGETEMIPKEFFVTSGKATSQVSELNAFDLALKNAGISQCNIVSVSSVLPPECQERKWTDIPIGSITFAVVARMDGKEDTTISAGIAWTWEKNKKYGIVAEAHGNMNQKTLKETLEWKIKEMAKIREIQIDEIKYQIETLKVPENNYASVIAALVYAF